MTKVKTHPLGGGGKRKVEPRKLERISTQQTWPEWNVLDPETPDDAEPDEQAWQEWQGPVEESGKVGRMIGAHSSLAGPNPLKEAAEQAAMELANRPDAPYQIAAERDQNYILEDLIDNPFFKPAPPPPRKGRIVFDDQVAFDVPLWEPHHNMLAKRYQTSPKDKDLPTRVRIERHVWVWLPPSYDDAILDPMSDRRYPVLYMLDGQNVFSMFGNDNGGGWGNWGIDEWIERLANPSWSPDDVHSIHPVHRDFVPGQRTTAFHGPRIREPIVVAIGCSNNRFLEYRGPSKLYTTEEMAELKAQGVPPSMRRHPGQNAYYDAFRQYLCDFLKPRIDSTYRTLPSPENTAILGSSMGGIAAFCLAWERPDIFGITIPVSPAFLVESEFFLRECVMRKGVELPEKGKRGPDTCMIQRKDLGWKCPSGQDEYYSQEEYDQHVKGGIPDGDVERREVDVNTLPFRVYLDSGISDYMGDDDGYYLTRELYNHLLHMGYPTSPSPQLSFFVDTKPAETEEELKGYHPQSSHGHPVGGGYALVDYKWDDGRINQHNEWYWRRRAWRMLEWAFPSEHRLGKIESSEGKVHLGTEAYSETWTEEAHGHKLRILRTVVTRRDFVDYSPEPQWLRPKVLDPETAPEDPSDDEAERTQDLFTKPVFKEESGVNPLDHADGAVERWKKRMGTDRRSGWSKLASLSKFENQNFKTPSELPADIDEVRELREKLAKAQKAIQEKKGGKALVNLVQQVKKATLERPHQKH